MLQRIMHVSLCYEQPRSKLIAQRQNVILYILFKRQNVYAHDIYSQKRYMNILNLTFTSLPQAVKYFSLVDSNRLKSSGA